MSFKLVLEGKADKEIPESSRLELLEKFSGNNFALSDAEYRNSGSLNSGSIGDLPLLRTLLAVRQKSWEPSFSKVMDSFVLAASRTFLQWLLTCLNFTIESEDLSFWYKWRKWFLWTMAASQAAENYGDEWCLTWYFLWRTYTSILTWTLSQNLLAAVKALSLKISSHGTSFKWSQRLFQSAQE